MGAVLAGGLWVLAKNISYDGLTSTALPDTMFNVKMTSAPRLPAGDSLRVPRLILNQRTAIPVGKSHGGGVLERPNPATAVFQLRRGACEIP